MPLFRRFPRTTPRDTDALYVARMLAWALQEPDVPCVLCGATGNVVPVSPCGHLVCRQCFDPSDYSACPICHRRLDAASPFLQPGPADAAADTAADAAAAAESGMPRPSGPPVRMQRLDLGAGLVPEATRLRDRLVGQAAPLDQAARDDLLVLVDATAPAGELSWLPEAVPVRQTLAVLTAHALASAPPERAAATRAAVAAQWQTATDIARTLWCLSGGDPGLDLPPRASAAAAPTGFARLTEWLRVPGEPRLGVPGVRIATLPRPLRRVVLDRLEALPPGNTVEDVLRHPTVWKRIAERLHPFESVATHPRASVVFSVLRESRHAPDSAAAEAIRVAAGEGWVRLVEASDGRVGARALTFGAQVERLLAERDVDGLLGLLGQRPGELIRRVGHLATWLGDDLPGQQRLVDAVAAAAARSAARVAFAAAAAVHDRDVLVCRPAASSAEQSRERAARVVALAAAGPETGRGPRDELPTDPGLAAARFAAGLPSESPLDRPWPRRVYFPSGAVARTWSVADGRPLLPAGVPDRLREAILAALTARAAGPDGARFDVAVLDAELAHVPIPAGTQRASGASAAYPRGALVGIPLAAALTPADDRAAPPDDDTLRLFLHWTDTATSRVDLDLSAMVFDDAWRPLAFCDYTALRSPLGLVHSGDLTSAPPPLGATEFLDLDLTRLGAVGVRYVAPMVLSYNDVPFDLLTDAFAGLALPDDGPLFDPARVLVRFDLRGDARRYLPFVVDLQWRELRWLDLHLGSTGYAHNIRSSGPRLAEVLADLDWAYGSGVRASCATLGEVIARARAARVLVLDRDEGWVDPAGQPVEAPQLAGARALVFAVTDPGALTAAAGASPAQLHPESVVVSAFGAPGATHSVDDLLAQLDLAQR